ncbi:hypothetical protein LRY65_00725 [Candidatus Woesebacteria bacterium]|nr:hypothetical protein [Candidatus Woesebacteria bacterium]MCD8507202.1 hypothetical protein [Candidatus Woesebacteria bacterium]MCD8526722.1 hypothetical protein [Candidatus Woesebacteria bacterium]MCD8546535.1 hypothetical protein [Candidatus Woesebacteria bacterium]
MLENIASLEEVLEVARVPDSQDIEYRQKLLREFPQRMSLLSVTFPDLRFHGTSFIAAKAMIEYGGVVSSQERGLVRSSFDGEGQISVTTPQSVELSVKDYIQIKDFLLPLGCLFVLLPEDQIDAAAGDSYLMKSVQFREYNTHSERFVCVLASAEVLPKVRHLLRENGYSEEKAMEFFEFLSKLES